MMFIRGTGKAAKECSESHIWFACGLLQDWYSHYGQILCFWWLAQLSGFIWSITALTCCGTNTKRSLVVIWHNAPLLAHMACLQHGLIHILLYIQHRLWLSWLLFSLQSGVSSSSSLKSSLSTVCIYSSLLILHWVSVVLHLSVLLFD